MEELAREPEVAFVLGGGGYLGGYQLGMLQALFERQITPDLVVGTSVGSIQGAMIAANPAPEVVDVMHRFWNDTITNGVMKVRIPGLLANLARLRPALASQDLLRELLIKYLGAGTRIEDLPVAYQCAAASIERSTARYFDSGPLIPALLASAAVPGLWPPVKIGDEHYIDGGVVETVPITRAISYGAKKIYVLRLRQREPHLAPPKFIWQLGQTVFEVSRRHRLGQVINMRPEGVSIHLIPTGEDILEPGTKLKMNVAQQLDVIQRRIDQGYRSACEYLDADGTRRSASIRAKARHTIANAASAQVDRPISAFVAAKLHHHFQMFYQDASATLTQDEYFAAADRISAAFEHPRDSHIAVSLREAFGDYWQAMCEATGTPADASLDHQAFDTALTRLCSSPAAYDTNILPVVAAIIGTADEDHDEVLNPAEIRKLLVALGVPQSQARTVSMRMDTNGDGVISIDELDEAFRDYFTTDEPDAVGNQLFGTTDLTGTLR